jgi:hypothetical protein
MMAVPLRSQLRIAVGGEPVPQLINSVNACRRVQSYLTDPYAHWSPNSPPVQIDGSSTPIEHRAGGSGTARRWLADGAGQ